VCTEAEEPVAAVAAVGAVVATVEAEARSLVVARAVVAAAGEAETRRQTRDVRLAGPSAAVSASVLRRVCVRRAPRGVRWARAAGQERRTQAVAEVVDPLVEPLAQEEPVAREPVARPQPAGSPGAEEQWLATPVPPTPAWI
jgi:hypothetical protein